MSGITPSTLRLTGMASGLDTESIVNDLLKVGKLKVEGVKKQKVLLEWKKEYYQEVTSKLNIFKSKYFGTTSSGGGLMGGSLSMLTATYKSPYVSVLAGDNAQKGSMYISDIVSLATNSRLSGTQAASANPTIAVNPEALGNLSGKSIAVTLNGEKKNITFSDRIYAESQDAMEEMSAQLASTFGAERISLALDGNNIVMSAENATLRISVPTDTGSEATTGILDFVNYSSNRLDFNMSLSTAGLNRDIFASSEDHSISFNINGKSFSFTGSNTINDIMTEVNKSGAGVTMSYSSLTDTFSLVSNATGSASSVAVSDTNGYLMDALFGGGRYTAGTDAEIKMSTNGSTDEGDMITLKRSTNTFDINGSTITLLGKADGTETEGISIGINYDTDGLTDKVKAFVDDYNDLLGFITGRLSEERYRDYQPLSDDEKESMTDKDVELWTVKAKSGLLRNDIYLQDIATSLKSSMYSVISQLGGTGDTLGILADAGITSGSYSEKGKLHLDEDKLRAALEKDPEKTMALFTQKSSISYSVFNTAEQKQQRFSESGVLDRISDLLSSNLSTYGVKGALINLVGNPNTGFIGQTEFSIRITDMQTRIDRMNNSLSLQEDRYWKQFTAMESALNKLSSQSSWLAGMLGQSQY